MSGRVFQLPPRFLRWGQLKRTPFSYILTLVKQYLISLKMYINDGLSDDVKKKFMLPLMTELHDSKEKVFHNAPVSLYCQTVF